MFRYLLPLLLALAVPCWGQTITLPEKVEGGVSAFISVAATTDGETVKWKALDAGLNVFPADLLKSTKTTVVSAPKAGRYRLMAYTAKDNAPSDPAETIIVVGTPGPDPPDPDDDDPKPTNFDSLTKAVAALAKDLPASERATVKAVYETTGKEPYTTIKERASVTSTALQTTLGLNAYDDWYGFRLGLAQELTKLKASGVLTESNHAQCWKAIAEGLK